MSILIASGVNLDLLGTREPEIYGKDSLKDMQKLLEKNWQSLAKEHGLKKSDLEFFQTNDEMNMLEMVSNRWDGIVINPGAWTHTSLAIADRLLAVGTPYVEVHLSNLSRRESFRQHSFFSSGARGVIQGFGIQSYLLGLRALCVLL